MVTKTPAGTLTEYTKANPPPRVRKGNVTLPQCSGGCGGVGRVVTPDYFICTFCQWRHGMLATGVFQPNTASRSIAMTENTTVETIETTTPEQTVENVEPAVPADEAGPEAPKAKRTPPKPKAKAGAKAKTGPKPAAKGGKGKTAEPKAPKAKPAAPADGGTRGIPDQLNKEIRWTPNKVALFLALQSLKAVGASAAQLPEDVAKASKGKLTEGQVRHQANPIFDLVVQGFIGRAEMPEGKKHGVFLTAKGARKAEALKAGK